MKRHFEKELEGLETSLIRMASIVEESIGLSVNAFLGRDETLARKVIDGHERVHALEIEIDNAIVDLLVLQQPVATDLRLILAAQKINNDLERIGDHAVNIAESAVSILTASQLEPLLIPEIADIAQAMLSNALDGLIHKDPELGGKVLAQDDEIDELNRKMVGAVVQLMKTDQQMIETGLQLIRVSRNLERVGDLATNIAEEVIFVTLGSVVKHRPRREMPP